MNNNGMEMRQTNKRIPKAIMDKIHINYKFKVLLKFNSSKLKLNLLLTNNQKDGCIKPKINLRELII